MKTMWKQTLVVAMLATAPLVDASDKVTCRVELDRAILPAGTPTRAVIKVTLDAPPPPARSDRPPVNLAIVLDRSGSMSGNKIERAREAAIDALRRLGPRDVFSLVMYDTEVTTLVPAQHINNVAAIEEQIRAIQPGSGTALFGGVSQGASELRKFNDGTRVNRLVLLSDGLANVGPSSPDELGRLGTALSKERITVSTVGVGTDYNEDLMLNLARQSDGNSYFVENSADLPRIFGAELGDVLSIVAQDVTVTVEFTDGCRPVRIIGREGLVRGNTVEVTLRQLYGGQQKYALVEVEVPESTPTQIRRIATATCRYEDVMERKRMDASAWVEARFSAETKVVIGSANSVVQEELIRNVSAEARQQAVLKADSGDNVAAARILSDNAAAINTIVVSYSVTNAAPAVEELKQEAESLSKEGMSRSKRKGYLTDSYQSVNQQLSQ